MVVFDGVMPEVKRREIERRRMRREKLWREDEDGSGGGALKRTAKKILVQRLREMKRMEGKSKTTKEVAGEDDKVEENVAMRKKRTRSSNGGGAFAAGFVPADVETGVNIMPRQNSSQDETNGKEEALNESSNDEGTESIEEVISIHSDEEMNQSDTNSENDWESSHAVQASIQNSITQQQSITPFLQEQTSFQTQTNEQIAALPSLTRSQYMESQFRARRIQSRRECIDVAADMEKYSEVQVKNFLMGSRLNQRMGEIGKLAGKAAENGDGGDRDETVEAGNSADGAAASNMQVSMEVLFGEKDDGQSNDEGRSDDEQSGGGFLLPSTNLKLPDAKSTELENVSAQVLSRESDVFEDDTEEKKIVENDAMNSIQSPLATAPLSVKIIESQQAKLVELVSAGDEWAAWGAESEDETKKETKQIDSSQLGAGLLQDDSSSDEEGGATFLTLSTAHKPNSLDGSRPSLFQASMTSDLSGVTDQANSDTDMNSVDWEDGDSNSEISNQEEVTDAADEPINVTIYDDNQPRNNDVDTKIVNQKLIESNIDSVVGSQRSKECDTIEKYCGNHSREDLDEIQNSTVQKNSEDENTIQNEDVIEINSDGDVDWEDGSDKMQTEIDTVEDLSGSNSNDHNIAINDKDTGERSEDIAYLNEFDAYQPENPNIAALQQAQETASKLTNWAGRAVQRAFASHLGQQDQQEKSPSENPPKRTSVAVDLGSNENENTNLSNVPTPKNTDASSPNHDGNHRRVEFLDTSIEGLNAAHHAILEEEKLMERDMSTITDEMKEDILKLLQLCGIPWIESPSEAEAQCAALEELGLVDGVVTEDSDIFVFGGKKVYKVGSSLNINTFIT